VKISVEIAYAGESAQALKKITVDPGVTVAQAIATSGILEMFPEIDINECQIGIYSKKVSRETVLKQNDRVEIYRPLKITPKEARRLRAKLAKQD